MTDKQMIDGIDVNKCQHYGKCSTYCYVVDEPCSDNPNCYYKQLKRKEQEVQQAMDNYVQLDLQRVKEYNELVDLYKAKEQECEALQMSENEAGEIIAELQAYKDINEDFKTAWEELKAENEELKKIINEAKNSNLDLKSFLVGEAVGNEYEQQLDQLKQTLAEIKDIAEIEIECKTYEIENDCFNETRCKALNEHIDFIKQILQKISECEANQ